MRCSKPLTRWPVEIADNSATAVQGAKQVLNYSMNKSIDDGLEYVAVWNAGQLKSD